MAAFKPLLSRGYRVYNPPPPCHIATLLRRHLSSEPQPTPPPEPQPSSQPNANFRNPVPIQPVSYPAKPQAPPPEEAQPEYIPGRPLRQSEGQQEREMPNAERRSWSRDEMRYMKDGPTISPVSYAARVAPLPEDRENVGEEEKGRRFEEMEIERRRIDEFRRRGGLRYGGMEVREEVNLPFPQLIRVENADKKTEEKAKTVYDVKEAIRLVKVGFYGFL